MRAKYISSSGLYSARIFSCICSAMTRQCGQAVLICSRRVASGVTGVSVISGGCAGSAAASGMLM